MQNNTIFLRDGENDIRLVTMVSDDIGRTVAPRPAIIVFPGGAYVHLSPREAEPVAAKFFSAGFQAFILYYSLKEKARFPRPLQEASMAIAHVRSNAKEYNVDPNRIFVIGFSAGGHLAASIGTMYERSDAAFPGMIPGDNKPNGMILSYAPCCSHMGKIAQSFLRTLGGDATEADLLHWSPSDNVTESTAPAYIWHTEDDPVVPVEHSLIMASKLAEKKIPFELHIFPHGTHGLALATAETSDGKPNFEIPSVAQWIDEAIDWALRTGINK